MNLTRTSINSFLIVLNSYTPIHSSTDQFADILTKGLSTLLFWCHCSNLMLDSSKPAIEEECKDIKGPIPATCQENREYNG